MVQTVRVTTLWSLDGADSAGDHLVVTRWSRQRRRPLDGADSAGDHLVVARWRRQCRRPLDGADSASDHLLVLVRGAGQGAAARSDGVLKEGRWPLIVAAAGVVLGLRVQTHVVCLSRSAFLFGRKVAVVLKGRVGGASAKTSELRFGVSEVSCSLGAVSLVERKSTPFVPLVQEIKTKP